MLGETSSALAPVSESMRGYRPKHFELRELVPPDIHAARGDAAWELLDPRALVLLDALRDTFGPCTVNDWHRGGRFKESGLRDVVTGTGARYSQHKYGRAFDCKFADATPGHVFDYLLERAIEFPELTVLEDVKATPSWLHFDVRAANWEGIRVVKP
jgi:hypothetical protein